MEQRCSCPICAGTEFREKFEYTEPPGREIRFDFSKQGEYHRKILCCERCHHYISTYKIDLTALYSADYINSNYHDMKGIEGAFKRIISLDPSKSDNSGRVKRILEFGEGYFSKQGRKGFIPSVLDVGSGLGVFPYGIVGAGWQCTALDPDDRAVCHIRDTVGVETIHGDFMTVEDIGEYDVITLNKVLEHVEQPIEMLKKAKSFLNKNGFIYVEVPDGEMAAMEGKEREEFFIDHIHVFSFTSLSLLIQKSWLLPLVIERLKEPSTKYTIRAFCSVLG